jgi:four helix bundle protein
MGEYKKLLVWQKAHALAIDVDRIAKGMHGGANASLRNQMIRAALSVPANIVEGRAQISEKEFLRFLGYALGSAAELDYHLLVAKDILAISEKQYWESEQALTEIRKMLYTLVKKIQSSANDTAA